MRALVLALALATPTLAFAQSSPVTNAGGESVQVGASVSTEGSKAAERGNLVGGAVAVPLGAASAAGGSAVAAAGSGLNAGARVADAAVRPIQDAFDDKPLDITGATVTAQPAPVVPETPQQ
ncbi:MAG: hypothetical protein NW203_05075 [Hyphomonadaceae bacterium]|nr:hypothetical protein [Hyphomonadaceae bacterium]